MEIKSLTEGVKTRLRSGFKINSFKHCVVQLVLNSIDAKSTAIAIRINLASFEIQVVDNGCGISQSNMNLVATRYATSKCRSLKELEKRPKCYGYRGEALASIVSCSKKINITSRVNDNENTYSKTFENGKWGPVEIVRFRPSKGTTITIENFLYNMPVRKGQIKPNLDLEDIRLTIESLSFIHPSITFSIRDNINKKVIFQSRKAETVSEALLNAYQDFTAENFEQLQVTKDKISVTGLIYKYPYSVNKLQLIYVNKIPVECHSIQKVVRKLFSKSSFHQRCIQVFENDANYAVYLLNISCPILEADITFEHTKTLVEFRKFDIVLKCVEKLITKFLQEEELLSKSKNDNSDNELRKKNASPDKVSSGVNISNIGGVFKSIPAKRKKNETIDENKKETAVKKRKSCNELETSVQKDINEIVVSHLLESKVTSAPKEHKKSVFDRHNNTQSLVLNSEIEDEPKIEEVDAKAALNENETKGKKLILDMFLKSSMLYESNSPKSIFNCVPLENFRKPLVPPGEGPKNKDGNTNMTVSVKVNTHRSSIYTVCDNGINGRKQTEYREAEVQTSNVRNFDDENCPKTKSTKCVQTTLEQSEFQMHFNIDNNNKTIGEPIPEITFYNILNTKLEESHSNDPYLYTFNSKTLLHTSIFHSDLKTPSTEVKTDFFNLKNPQNFCTRVDTCCCKSKMKSNDCQSVYSHETTLSNTKYIEETYNLKNMYNFLKSKCNDVPQSGINRNVIYINRKRCGKLDDNYYRKCHDFYPKIQRSNKRQSLIEEANRRGCYCSQNNVLRNEKHKNLYDNVVPNQNYHTYKNKPFVPRSFDEQCSTKCSFDSHENYLKRSNSFPTCPKYCTNNYNKKIQTKCNCNGTRNQKFVQHENYLDNQNKHFVPPKQQIKTHWLQYPETKREFKTGYKNAKRNYGRNLKTDAKNAFKFKKPLDVQYKSKNNSSKKLPLHSSENIHNFQKSQRQENLFYNKEIAEDSNNIIDFTLPYNTKGDENDFLFEKTLEGADFNNLETIKSVEHKGNNINIDIVSPEIGNPFCESTPNILSQKRKVSTVQEDKGTQCERKSSSLKKPHSFPEASTSLFFTDFHKNTLSNNRPNYNYKEYLRSSNHCSKYSQNCPLNDNVLICAEHDENKTTNRNQLETIESNENKINVDIVPTEIGNSVCESTTNIFSQKEKVNTVQEDKGTQCERKSPTLKKPHSFPEASTSLFFTDFHKNTLTNNNRPNANYKEYLRSSIHCSKSSQNCPLKDNVLICAELDENKTANRNQLETIESNENKINVDIVPTEIENSVCESSTNIFSQKEKVNTVQEDKGTLCESKSSTLKKTHSFPEASTSPLLTDFHKNTLTNNNRPNANYKEYLRSSNHCSKSSQNCPLKDNVLICAELDENKTANRNQLETIESNENKINVDIVPTEIENSVCESSTNIFSQKEKVNTVQEDKGTQCERKSSTLKKPHSFPEASTSPLLTDFHKNTLTNNNRPNANYKEYLRSSNHCSKSSQNCPSKENVLICAELGENKTVNSHQNVSADEQLLMNNKKSLESKYNNSENPDSNYCDEKEDKLVITFSESEMNLLIKKEILGDVNNCNNDDHSDCSSTEENNKIIEDRKNFDLKTGMTLCSNFRTADFFNFTKRIPCIPKGLSPILKFNTEVDTELSQNSKNALLMKIMQGYEDELKEIKWEKIKTEADVNGVLDELYTAKCKSYETICPVLLPLNPNQVSAITFSKDIFNEINIIGSVDKKFIVVYAHVRKLLIIIDQHAAHERVRLEILIDQYKQQEVKEVTFKQSKLKETIPLRLSRDAVQSLSLNDVKNHFKKLGVSYNIQENIMDVVAVPTCLFNKVFENVEAEKEKLLKLFVSSFIKEELDFLKNSRCFSKTIPNFLNKIINLEACRGAIKFGDMLTIEECKNLIRELSLCKLPFQCAHGRPTMMPLADMRKMPLKQERDKVNLKKLKY